MLWRQQPAAGAPRCLLLFVLVTMGMSSMELVPYQPQLVEQVKTIHVHDVELRLVENYLGSSGTGGLIWSTAIEFATFCHQHIDWTNQRVLELGSGTGVLGLLLLRFGAANVTLTDQASIVPLLERNVALNGLKQRGASVKELTWGSTSSAFLSDDEGRFDYIVGSDITYHPRLIPLLLDTLSAYTTPGQTRILLAHMDRYPARTRIFEAAAERRFHLERRLHNPPLTVYELRK